MKFSDNAHYVEYMSAYADGRHEVAIKSLEECLEDFRESTYQKAFLLQRLGDIYLQQGSVDRSLGYFALAEEADPESLQPKYAFAEFLARKLKRPDEAIKKCDEILRTATASPFEETDEDFGSDYYIAKASQLRQFCVESKAQHGEL